MHEGGVGEGPFFPKQMFARSVMVGLCGAQWVSSGV